MSSVINPSLPFGMGDGKKKVRSSSSDSNPDSQRDCGSKNPIGSGAVGSGTVLDDNSTVMPTGGPYSGKTVPPSLTQREVFTQDKSEETVKKFVARGRFSRGAGLFSHDIAVGKIGTLGAEAVMQLEAKLLAELYCGEVPLSYKARTVQQDFLSALYMYLAVNSGSIGNATGRMGVADDSEPLTFGGCSVSATQVATILGDKAYAYMRARATEIRDVLESLFATVDLPGSPETFPGLCSVANLVRVVAAKRGLSQYPQYAAVGSEYAAGTPAFLVSLIATNSAKLLSGTTSNVRHTEVV